MAGQKLTEGNLAITDLGNPNRPAKIGERWASLYSDEWTDVFEEIIQKNENQDNKDETPEKHILKIVDVIIRLLLHLKKSLFFLKRRALIIVSYYIL